MKNTKIFTRVVTSFIVLEVLVVLILVGSEQMTQAVVNGNIADPESYMNKFRIFAAIAGTLILLIMAGLAFSIGKSIKKSTAAITEVSERFAQGEVHIDIPAHDNDEFGILLDEYGKAIAALEEYAGILGRLAEGDMTVRLTPKSEKDEMGLCLKRLVERNNRSLYNIREGAEQVMTSAGQVSSASESLAEGATEQASAIEQITASISEVAEKTRANADEADQADKLMEEAIRVVGEGNRRMGDMTEAMQEINKASADIQKIIKVIDDIAFQTNILALNAAVEAARAGEAGKGFAVVAEEVRNLAAKSASAAAETAEMIENSIAKTEAGASVAGETAKALDQITSVVSRSKDLVKEIADSSKYQATAVAQVDQAIGQVSDVVQTNSATSQQCAAAAQELSDQAVRMREQVEVYRLDESVRNRAGLENSPNEKIISLRDH